MRTNYVDNYFPNLSKSNLLSLIKQNKNFTEEDVTEKDNRKSNNNKDHKKN